MTNRTIVIRRNSYGWQNKIKRKRQFNVVKRTSNAGFISPVLVVVACSLFFGLFYIYSVNRTAVKGIEIKRAEQEIENQKKTNETLKIKEAQLKSLYHIEEQSKNMDMVDSSGVKYIEENPSVALSK